MSYVAVGPSELMVALSVGQLWNYCLTAVPVAVTARHVARSRGPAWLASSRGGLHWWPMELKFGLEAWGCIENSLCIVKGFCVFVF